MRFREFSVRVLNHKKNPAEETAEGYVPLEEGEHYTLLLNNLSGKDAVALITIDGKDVAHVKVGKKSKLEIDAPANSDQQFTFYRKSSEEGKELFGGVSKDDLGLIQVQFVEVPDDFQYKTVTSGHTTIYIPYYDWWRPAWRPFISPWWGSSDIIYNSNSITIGGSVSGYSEGPQFTYTSGVDSLGQNITTAAYTVNNLSVSGGTGLSGLAKHMPVDVEASKEKFDKFLDDHNSTTIKVRLILKKDKQNRPTQLRGYSTPTPPPLE
jgi:hypothetical protein